MSTLARLQYADDVQNKRGVRMKIHTKYQPTIKSQ